MKVVFITPASDTRRRTVFRLGNRLYGHSNSITGPLILGHILKDAGHEVEVYEELHKDIDYKKFRNVDVFCLYTMTSTAPRAYTLADMLKKTTNARILIGGMHASVMPDEAAEHADQVVVGEAESVICDVVEGRIPDRIVYAKANSHLDDIPFPDYSILKSPCDVANVMSTRGCPFCCTFCTTSRMFYPYRERSVESVIEELRYYKRIGFKYVNFEDDNFTANKKRAKEICSAMIAEGLIFREIFFFGRTDMGNDEELLSLLEQAHFTRVLIGIESLNQDALNDIDKRQKVSDIENCSKALARHRIKLIASLVLGIDSDGIKDIRRSVNFARSINAYQLQPAILTPFPGTAIYEQYQQEHRMLSLDWTLYDMMNVTFIPRKMSPWQLLKEFTRAIRKFYSFIASFKIWKNFGANYGLRRMGLAIVSQLGVMGIALLSVFGKKSHYYALRHWRPSQAVLLSSPHNHRKGFGIDEKLGRI